MEATVQTRDLVLAHLAGELERGILLDYLKEQGLIPEREARRQERPPTAHVRWMIRRDLPRVLTCEAGTADPWDKEGILRRMSRSGTIANVIEVGGPDDDGEVVAWMCYRLLADRLILERLTVHPDWRRRGLGAMLAARLRRKLADHRRPHAEAEVSLDDLSACLFLAAVGFRLEGHDGGKATLVLGN